MKRSVSSNAMNNKRCFSFTKAATSSFHHQVSFFCITPCFPVNISKHQQLREENTLSNSSIIFQHQCGVSLKDRRRSVDLYSLLGVQSVSDVVRHGRLRWLGHLERKGVDDWVSASRNVVVAGVRCVGSGRKT